MAAKPRVKIPDAIKAGDIIEIKTLISHVMETGQRKDNVGASIPRSIINTFIATFGGNEVFKADLHPGTSANPFISFYMRVPGSGDLVLTWIDDAGTRVVEQVKINAA